MLSIILKNIRKKPTEDLYCVNEAGFHYEFNKESLDDFIKFNNEHDGLIADWYRALPEKEKSKVIRRFGFE